jgi:hypothetical protein
MTPAQRDQTARLFAVLARGEAIAHDCARRQAELVDDSRSRRFLLVQALQERTHRMLFDSAAGWLAPQQKRVLPPAMIEFEQLLQQALARGDLTESLIASQVVLEGLGEQILIRLNRGLDKQGIGFARQRRVLLHQEQGHFAFGQRLLLRRLQSGQARSGQVQELAGSYLLLVMDIVAEMAEVFDVLDEDTGEYTEGLVAALPSWLLPPESNATELTGPAS